ncbi:Rab geranylgeranyltransferase [Coemansia biformis]|uniref:Geranylgeranyl transferase type-2 subunit alpha n=1 Tax=Coemansia biformis TaxID=1286918 RepID=A0A9W7YGB1_9FUNG|nr:Rab geranylgeranyltransferase [Coemansia biformis]
MSAARRPSVHGRRRQAAREPTAEERAQAQRQLEQYCALNHKVMEQRARNEFTNSALEATKQLLEQNTELHTVWNYRRQIFAGMEAWQDESERQRLLEEELMFLQQVIRKNIKSYWMWGHRVWVLKSLPHAEWERELGLAAKLLAVDARNYHGWNYRRFVVSRLKAAASDAAPQAVDEQEFAFTTEQINKDCANHAAWHNRSKLLPAILAARDEAGRDAVLAAEDVLILNAIYTDPDDQNAWLYCEWLQDIQRDDPARCRLLRQRVSAIRELLELEDDSRRPLIELVSALVELDRLEPGAVADAERGECIATLRKLAAIDPLHIGRYDDWGSALGRRWGLA